MKKCTKCLIIKPIVEFYENKRRKEGTWAECKICLSAHRKTRYRTKEGLINNIYRNQQRVSRRRGHYPPAYSKEWLLKWLVANPRFHQQFDAWEASNYNPLRVPSVDRIRNNVGYIESNIQLMSWGENCQKGRDDHRACKFISGKPNKPVMQYHINGEFVAEFISQNEASRRTKINRSNISSCCAGKVNTAGGFRWANKDKQIEEIKTIEEGS